MDQQQRTFQLITEVVCSSVHEHVHVDVYLHVHQHAQKREHEPGQGH
jgi:hypothetical protein